MRKQQIKSLSNLRFGSKKYDGSSAISVTASDIGALATSKANVVSDPSSSYITTSPAKTGSNTISRVDYAVSASGNCNPFINVWDGSTWHTHNLYTSLNKPGIDDVTGLRAALDAKDSTAKTGFCG